METLKKSYWKYFWKTFVGVFLVGLFGFLDGPNEMNYFYLSVLFVIGIPLILAVPFALLEDKYYPYLNKKTATIFDATIYDDYHSTTKIGKFDLFIKLNAEGSLPIEFHVPRKQIDKKKHKPKFEYVESNIFEVKTYLIEKSSYVFLSRNKKKIEKEFESMSRYK